MGAFTGLFDTAALTPHGYCLSWEPGLIALHVVSDGLITASYYSIPLAIALLLLRRGDVAFSWMAWLFAIFIMACGTTHLMGIWTLWYPDYLTDGMVKAVTAVASVMTAAALWPLLPRLVALPSPGVLLQANERLTQQIAERDAAVTALRRRDGGAGTRRGDVAAVAEDGGGGAAHRRCRARLQQPAAGDPGQPRGGDRRGLPRTIRYAGISSVLLRARKEVRR